MTTSRSCRPPTLDDLQRWFQAVVTHPGGVRRARLERRPAATRRRSRTLLAPSSQQSAEERLAVYAHAYWARLLECLREEFPIVRAAVGDEAFDAFAVGYLQASVDRATRSASSANASPQYLAETIAARCRTDASAGRRRAWRSSNGPSTKCSTLPAARRSAFSSPERSGGGAGRTIAVRCGSRRCRRSACSRSSTTSNDLFTRLAATDRRRNVAAPELVRTFVALSRREFIVRRHPLSPMQYELLDCARRRSNARRGDCASSRRAAIADDRRRVGRLAANLVHRMGRRRVLSRR